MRILNKAELPPLLREIPDAPGKLYLEGTLPDQKENVYLTVVGSRRASGYGKDACHKIIAGLAGYPIVIVSGLAIGIDSLAHREAMRAGLKTVAIPGSGLDRKVIYPSSNASLADEILENHGALLSEYEPDQKATLYSFPERNRIMAGMAKAVLVIEAGQKSGTLITARLALDYNRDVLAVPGSIFSPNSLGTNWLIREGASPVTSSAELLIALGFDMPENGGSQRTPFDLTEAEKKVFYFLTDPLPQDDLIKALGLEISEANALIVSMQMKGFIKERDGELHLNIF